VETVHDVVSLDCSSDPFHSVVEDST